MIAPKKAGLVREEKLKKKVASRLINAMEQSLAAKAGHLELLRSGKKDKKIEAVAAAAATAKGKQPGWGGCSGAQLTPMLLEC